VHGKKKLFHIVLIRTVSHENLECASFPKSIDSSSCEI